jgi:hypothetical protein
LRQRFPLNSAELGLTTNITKAAIFSFLNSAVWPNFVCC